MYFCFSHCGFSYGSPLLLHSQTFFHTGCKNGEACTRREFSFAMSINNYRRRVWLPAWALRCSLRLSFLVKIFPQRLHGKMVLGAPRQFLLSACRCHLGLPGNSLPQEEQITRSFPDSFTTKVWAYRCLKMIIVTKNTLPRGAKYCWAVC